MHEVAKLNDPAIQFGNANLSIHYVAVHGDWPAPIAVKLFQLRDELQSFAIKTKSARNKLLAHKDAKTIVAGISLGEFNIGEDEIFFDNLREFASTAHEHYHQTPFPFDDLTQNDVEIFTSTFVREILSEGSGE